jgi:YfiR/HmsC-like
MIAFLLDENRVRFDINLAASQSAGLTIGSRLLVLAKNVTGESRAK